MRALAVEGYYYEGCSYDGSSYEVCTVKVLLLWKYARFLVSLSYLAFLFDL